MLPALPNSQFSTLNSKFPCQEAIFTKAKTPLAKCSKPKSWKRQMSTKNYYVNRIFVICGMLKKPSLVNKPVNNVENSLEITRFIHSGAVFTQKRLSTFSQKSTIFRKGIKIMSPVKPVLFFCEIPPKVGGFFSRFP